jgi:hypothetical protein
MVRKQKLFSSMVMFPFRYVELSDMHQSNNICKCLFGRGKNKQVLTKRECSVIKHIVYTMCEGIASARNKEAIA